jgi:hypothetical protein
MAVITSPGFPTEQEEKEEEETEIMFDSHRIDNQKDNKKNSSSSSNCAPTCKKIKVHSLKYYM